MSAWVRMKLAEMSLWRHEKSYGECWSDAVGVKMDKRCVYRMTLETWHVVSYASKFTTLFELFTFQVRTLHHILVT